MTGASAGGAAAAAKAARMRQEEEEEMTRYSQEDLEGWEFKIVRANTRRFKDYKEVQRVCQEEARAGWELMEKFDDQRLRFKRRTDRRTNDHLLEIDPYRTTVGIGQGSIAVIVLTIIAVLTGLAVLITLLAKG